MGSLESHEKRMTRFSEQPLEQAFQSKISFSRKKDGGQNKGNQDQPRHFRFQRGGRSNSSRGRGGGRFYQHNKRREYDKFPSRCDICKKTNHDVKDCWFRQCTSCKNSDHKFIDCPRKKENEVHISESKDDATEQLFYTCSSSKEKEGVWYIDSGCSNHMTGVKQNFISLDESFKSNVKLGDGKYVKAEGKGEIAVQSKQGSTKFIKDVLYVPSLSQNLLSVGQLAQKGYMLNFNENSCSIIDKKANQLITKVQMTSNKVFPLFMDCKEDFSMKAEVPDKSMLWHFRYGHLNYHSLKELHIKNMVIGLPQIKLSNGVCEGCVYGKMHRLPFPKSAWRAKTQL